MDKKTILAIDDTTENLYILSELLHDYNVVLAASGLEGLEIVAQQKIDLILLDVIMPIMDGYSVCEKLKANIATKDIPVIFLTAKNDKESIEKGYEVGGIDYVIKPFLPKELLTKVKKQIQNREDAIDLKDLVLRSKGLKILFVENDIDEMESSLKLFEKFFTHIDLAHDPKEAFDLYKKNSKTYDLVISNLTLSNIDGIELSKSILNINKKQAIILLSHTVESTQLEEMLDVGVSNFLYKPISFNSLINILQKIVKKIEEIEFEYERLNDIQKLNHELDAMIDSFDRYVIASRTDLQGKITYASKAYEEISGYTSKELIGQPHNIVRHPDMPKSAFESMWRTIKSGKLWVGDVKNLRKDKSAYWVKANVAPYYDKHNNHIGYSAIRIDITAQKEVELLHKEVANLLNNVSQGFLSFNDELKIQKSYSKECLKIFKTDEIKDKSIVTLLFSHEKEQEELFLYAVEKLFQTEDTLEKELYLSLLPNQSTINKREITVEYKLLEDNKIMLILTDITQNNLLKRELEEQNKIQKMIVSVVSNKNDFLDIKKEFIDFLHNIPQNLSTILRELHTFKGIFAQKNMIHTPNAIHQLESLIGENQELNHQQLVNLIEASQLETFYQKDLSIIQSILSCNLVSQERSLEINVKTIEALEEKLLAYKTSPSATIIDELIDDIEKLKYESVYDLLKEYTTAVKQTAQKLSKEIYPLTIEGDSKIVVAPKYKPFFKSLIHLFNNCVDHGIEDIETRIENEKDEIGTISCNFEQNNDTLEVIICDDGGGIAVDKVIQKAIKNSIITQNESENLDENQKLILIFSDSLSTKESTDETSGRGIGMGAIKNEIEKLNGTIDIKNTIGKGVAFHFKLNIN